MSTISTIITLYTIKTVYTIIAKLRVYICVNSIKTLIIKEVKLTSTFILSKIILCYWLFIHSMHQRSEQM